MVTTTFFVELVFYAGFDHSNLFEEPATKRSIKWVDRSDESKVECRSLLKSLRILPVLWNVECGMSVQPQSPVCPLGTTVNIRRNDETAKSSSSFEVPSSKSV